MDNFGFPVGGRLATRRAVFQPLGQNMTIDKFTNDFLTENLFLKLSLKLIELLWKAFLAPSVTATLPLVELFFATKAGK